MFNTTSRVFAKQNIIRNTLLITAMAFLMIGCTTQQITPADALERLTTAYDHPTFDPSAAAWEALVTHPAYAKDEIVFLEIMALNETENALEQVNAYVNAVTLAIEETGGELIYVYDILSEGTGDLYELLGDLYRGGVAYSARFPSRAALVETMLSSHARGSQRDHRGYPLRRFRGGSDRCPRV